MPADQEIVFIVRSPFEVFRSIMRDLYHRGNFLLLAFQELRPVQDNRDRIGCRRCTRALVSESRKLVGKATGYIGTGSRLRDEKPLAIRGNGVKVERRMCGKCLTRWIGYSKKHTWNARLNRRAHDPDLRTHDVGGESKIKFLSVASPAWKSPTVGGDLPFAGTFRKRFDVDFEAASFV